MISKFIFHRDSRSTPTEELNRFVGRLLVGCLFLSLVALGNADALAQGLFRNTVETPTAEFLPAPRSVRQQIREADLAIQEERFSDAVARLGDLLRRIAGQEDSTSTQDYFILPDESSTEFEASSMPQSILAQARQMIESLPSAGIELYELRYGPLARKMLTDAGKDRDWEKVGQVRREFFHTEAGYEASLLLAMREWHLGNPLAASLLLDDVVQLRPAVEHLTQPSFFDAVFSSEPNLASRVDGQSTTGVISFHAAACLLGGRELSEPIRWPDAFVSSLEGQTPDMERWQFWIEQSYLPTAVQTQASSSEYPFMGGKPDRNGLSAGQMPLSNPRWMLESTGSPRQERMVAAQTRQLKTGGLLPPPSWVPLRVGDQLLMRTTQRLLGVDHATGKRIWQYPWFSPPEQIKTSEDDGSSRNDDQIDPQRMLTQRVWNDVPYGQLSSDGERVYMIDDLGKIEIERFSPFGLRGSRSVQAGKNSLVALDLATEGKLLWRLGSVETTASEFSETFFLGPPLPVRGKLYAIAEMAGELVLLCLRPEDGTLLWRQVLVSVDSGGITTDPVRRVAGAMPSYHQGILLCPTGAGVTIAVNLIDRTLRWGNRHPRNQEFARNVFRPTPEVSMSQLSQRWSSSVPVASGTSIVLTPVESDRLIVADALTGESRFRPQTRARKLYVAGIRDDQYFVVGAETVWAHDLYTGDIRWTTSSDLMRSGQRVSGHGVFGENSYFLPTTTDELVEISLDMGEVVSRRDVRFPLGNLLAVDGEIISQATTTLAVAYGEASLQPRVDEILKKDPNDFTALIRKAEILMQQDERTAALELLRQARELDPKNDEVILLSVDAMLQSLRADEATNDVDLDELSRLIDRPEQKAELLVLQIRSLIDVDTRVNQLAAFDRLLELSQLVLDEPSIADARLEFASSVSHEFTLDSWVAARVAAIVRSADAETKDAMTDQLTEYLSKNRRYDRVTLKRVTHQFSALADRIEMQKAALADRLLVQGDALATERLVWGTHQAEDQFTSDLSNMELMSLARLYSKTAWASDRRWVGELLQERMKAAVPSNSSSVENLQKIGALLDEYPVVGLASSIDHSWPKPAAKSSDAEDDSDEDDFLTLNWSSSSFPQSRALMSERRYAMTSHLLGKHTDGWQAVSDNNPLALLNENGISRAIVVEGLTTRAPADKEVTMSGGLMLLLTPSELIAVDLFRVLAGGAEPAVRWRMTLGNNGQPVAKRRSAVTVFGDQVFRYLMNSPTAIANDARMKLGPVLGDRVFLLRGSELVCLDTVTGQTMWRVQSSSTGIGVVVRSINQGQSSVDEVGILSQREKQIEWFDVHDGGQTDIQEIGVESVIAISGRHVLNVVRADSESELEEPYKVELLNVSTNATTLTRVASAANRTDQPRSSAYAELVDGRYFGLLDNDGLATIWDVATGKSIAEVTVPVRSTLYGLSMMKVNGQFVLMPRSRLEQTNVSPTHQVNVAGGVSVKAVTGLHAISVDGEKRWSRSFKEAWGMSAYHPWASPILLLVRGHSRFEGTASRKRELDVSTVDMRDGNTLHELLRKNISSGTNLIESQIRLLPRRNQVIATIQSELLSYTFPEPAIDVEPSLDVESSLEASSDPDEAGTDSEKDSATE